MTAAFALKGFLVPNKFFDGGVTGISLLIHEIYHINLALVILLANLPFIILSMYGINYSFAIKTLVCILLLGLCLHYLPYPIITSDKLLVSIFGVFFLGVGIGLTMRAEAKLRKNDAAGALLDVNTVRMSRTAYTVKPAPLTGTLTLDILFRERGFELYWEMQRRTDMIRFGKYEGAWTEKNNTDKNKRLFPIPQTAIDGASNLPGYLKQNPGY